ncbi:CRISPR-associated protein Cas4 [Mesoaciditoga lauensis]|uniref:CRISPR-associated protein Cas4 n=1 Tax=Mesoaciditoga lauensis TaxID=1495039 RepID=UPI00068D9FA8|nr:CRISPR-associated protein Cas4 [Mesoaciditoga lauensis]
MTPHITASMLAAVVTCPREAWLMSRAFSPDEENYFLVLGKLIHEESYKRMKMKEIELDGMKIDFITEKDGQTIVAEIKKSSHGVESGKIQLLYYMKNLRDLGINLKGELRVPTEKKIIKVELDEENERALNHYIDKLLEIISLEKPPAVTRTSYCRKCAFESMCFS